MFFNLVTWWTFMLTIFPNKQMCFKHIYMKMRLFYILVTWWLICMNLHNLIHSICLCPTDTDTGLVVWSGPSCFF